MKLFKKAQSKILVALAVLCATVFSLVANFKIPYLSVNAQTQDITTYDTEVKNIVFKNVSGGGYLGFELTESDYTIEGDYGDLIADTSTYDYYLEYQNYITNVCTYFKDFNLKNSGNVNFKRDFSYWDKGTKENYVGVGFENTLTHPFNLAMLEYGFMIEIPAGTLFPKYSYAKTDFTGTPEVYKTLSDKAFYYDGSAFVEIPVAVAQEKENANDKLDNVDLDMYLSAEREQVNQLIASARAQINVSFTIVEITEIINDFETDLGEIMTVLDYQLLAEKKADAKAEIETFFLGFDNADYDQAEWDEIVAIMGESQGVIDSVKKISDVESVVAGIKYRVGSVLTKEEKAEFEDYRSQAKRSLETAFNPTLYLDAEVEIGNALVIEGKNALDSASNYDEVDGIEAYYLSKIRELKTKAEWESENPPSSEIGSEPTENNSPKSGWIFAIIGGAVALLGSACAVVLIILKNKNKKQNENKEKEDENEE